MKSLMTRGNLFDDFFKELASPGYFIQPLHGDALPSPSQIRVDVKETDSGYSIEAELPGVSKENIKVSIEGNQVSLSAEVRQLDEQKDGEKSLRSERYYGSVSRSFQLPSEIDSSQAKARYEDGVLKLTLPKKQSSASHQLTID